MMDSEVHALRWARGEMTRGDVPIQTKHFLRKADLLTTMKRPGSPIYREVSAKPGVPDRQDATPTPTIKKNVPYLRTKAGTQDLRHNGKVKFIDRADTTAASGEVAVCRHFVSVLGLKALASQDGKIALSDVDSPASVARNITSSAEQAYENIRTTSRNVSIFNNDQFAAFLKTQFRQMECQNMAAPQPYGHEALAALDELGKEPGSGPAKEPDRVPAAESSGYKTICVTTFLIESTNHAMLLRLRVKEKQGRPLYVASFYDPNRTVCLVRCEVSNLSELESAASSYSLAAFINPLGPRRYDRYFPAHTAPIALALEVPSPENEAPPSVEARDRALQSCSCQPSATFMFHLMGAGFPENIRDIGTRLMQAGSTPDLALLAAKEATGIPGLYMALQNGHADAIRAWGVLLALVPHEERTEIVKELLAAKRPDGTPGLWMALRFGHADAIREWGVLLALVPESQRAALFKDLLAAKRANGSPGLWTAIRYGKASAIRVWGELFNKLPRNTLVTRELAALIFAMSGSSETAVSALLANPDAETEQAWTSLLVHLPEKLRHAALEALKNKNQNGSAEALRKALHAVLTDTNA